MQNSDVIKRTVFHFQDQIDTLIHFYENSSSIFKPFGWHTNMFLIDNWKLAFAELVQVTHHFHHQKCYFLNTFK